MAYKILCVGDSLVEGYNAPGFGGWRIGLYNRLSIRGVEFDFVGGVTSGEVAHLPDRECEGHQGEALTYFTAAMPTYMSTYTPDVVIVCAGTAHVLNAEATPTDAYGDLIAAIYAADSNCKVVCCTVPNVTGAYSAFSSDIVTLNEGIHDVAAVHRALGRTCVVSHCPFNTPTDDGAHPTPAGYEGMADSISAALSFLHSSRPTGRTSAGNGRGARNR